MLANNRDIAQYTKDYLNHDFENTMVEYRRKKVLEILNKYRPQNILEVGCGIQSIFDFYSNYQTFTVVEPSKEFCEMVKKSKRYNQNISIVCDFLENKIEQLKHNKYDFIIVSCLLHEVMAPQKLLESVKLLCTEETIVHINVPNAKSFHLLWAYKSGLIDTLGNLTETAKKLQQNTTFDLDKLISIANQVNLDVIDKGSYFIKPFNHSKMQKCMALGIIDEQLLNGLYKLTNYIPDMGAEIFINCRLK